MKCHAFDHRISAFVDGQLTGSEHREVSMHLALCDRCATEKKQVEHVRGTLRKLPAMMPPEGLDASLRVIASKERAYRATRASASAFLDYWRENVRLWANNLMRPLAIPAVGGLTSAVMLFSMLVPTFTMPVVGGYDIPTPFYRAATVKSTMEPFGLIKGELVVDVTIDGNGRMVEYSIPQGQPGLKDPALIRTLETHLIFTEFTPATAFGQPMFGGKIRVFISRAATIEIKG